MFGGAAAYPMNSMSDAFPEVIVHYKLHCVPAIRLMFNTKPPIDFLLLRAGGMRRDCLVWTFCVTGLCKWNSDQLTFSFGRSDDGWVRAIVG